MSWFEDKANNYVNRLVVTDGSTFRPLLYLLRPNAPIPPMVKLDDVVFEVTDNPPPTGDIDRRDDFWTENEPWNKDTT